MYPRFFKATFFLALSITIALSACTTKKAGVDSSKTSGSGGGGGGSSGSSGSSGTTITTGDKTITVSWTANREKAVNSSGGGYRVYYSTTSNFSTASASYVNAPYVSGVSAPTTADITGLSSGTYYIKVNAYSSLNTAGNTSTQISVSVP